jgi:hypothetical protein
MAESSRAVMVTEEMLTEAVKAGDLERLESWARQGVRVTTEGPLYVASQVGCLDVLRFLVREMGANVNQKDQYGETPLMVAVQWEILHMVQRLVKVGADANQAMPNNGRTPLHIAAGRGNLAIVHCLVEVGAEIGALDKDGNTALLESARGGHYLTMQYLLEDAGANMEDVDKFGSTVWDMLRTHLEHRHRQKFEEEDDLLALTGVLRVLVLRGAPPPALVALLSPEPARVVQEGARLRARLPAYLAHRRAYLDLRCPHISLLPSVLRTLIYNFEEPSTEELWSTGLGQASI